MLPQLRSVRRASALTNAVAKVLPRSALAGTRAVKRSADLSASVLVCHKGLVPGDKNAVDWAQEAHGNLLQHYGTYLPAHQIQIDALSLAAHIWRRSLLMITLLSASSVPAVPRVRQLPAR